MFKSLSLLAGLASIALALPTEVQEIHIRQSAPSATVKNGTVVGTTSGGIDSFSGIPFAQPPVGNLRLHKPRSLTQGFPGGSFDASKSAAACPQFAFQVDNLDLSNLPNSVVGDVIGELLQSRIAQVATNQKEDCLTITVQRPAGTTAKSKLPVIFWIYGGGFEAGWSAMYDGSNFIKSSVNLGKPVVYVAVNYRLNGFGFLGGKELAAEGATNLGLRDQRLGLQWVQENIAAFGGDPSKVTIWGESAGSISVFDHTVINGGDNTYNGKPLFRAAIMNSGSVIPATDVSSPKPQAIYDKVVASSPCAGNANTVSCLRGLDYATFLRAVSSVPGIFSYRSLDLSYLPRPDPGDNFFSKSPELPLQAGRYAKVPTIIGDQEDEGTLFSLVQSNITTNDDLVNYIASYFPADPNNLANARNLAAQYPDMILAGQPSGSPFRTGGLNSIYPQFKRLAAILGDLTFTLTRRSYLNFLTNDGVPAWSYLSTFFYGSPILGTFHATDVIYSFFTPSNTTVPTRSFHTYYINLIYDLDPNSANLAGPVIQWPRWSNSTPSLLNFGSGSNSVILDNFRQAAYDYVQPKISELRV